MLNLEEIIRTEKHKLADNTVKKYARDLEIVKERSNGDDDFEFLEDYETVLSSMYPLAESTIRTKFIPVLILLKYQGKLHTDAFKFYDEFIDGVNAEYTQNAIEGEMTEKEMKNQPTTDDLDNVIKATEPKSLPSKDKIKKQDYNTALLHFLFVLYKHLPLRNDYADMVVVKTRKEADKYNKTSMNVFVNNKFPRFILNSYKTNKKYGQKVIPINEPELLDKIKWWLKVNKSDKYFISSLSGDSISRKALSSRLRKGSEKYTGKKFGSSMLRKTAVSKPEFIDASNTLQGMAYKMCHSLNSQTVYIKKKKPSA